MRYKTIVLDLLNEQYPALIQRLQRERMMLKAMEAYARLLSANHEAWKNRLAEHNPRTDPTRIASEALELAMAELLAALPSESPTSGGLGTPVSLEEAIAFIRSHMPPA
jgi:hypothetical protein